MDDHRRQDFDPDRPDLAFAGGPRPLGHDPLLRLLAVNWLIGAAVAVALVAFVLVTDTARLRTLMFASREPWIPLMLLFFGFLVTMCSVAMATAVMLLPEKDDDDQGPGGGTPLEVLSLPFPPRMQPVPIRVEAPRRPGRDSRGRY
jgi:hypothetical protein